MSSPVKKPPQDTFSPIEITFHGTSRKKLAWFYQLLVTEFIRDSEKIKKVANILKDWKQDYDLDRLEQIDKCLSGYPLLQMAFNVMLNSDVTCISLEVPVKTEEDIKIFKDLYNFRQYYNRNMDLDEGALTQQFLTKEVELKAINDERYAEVLYAMSLYKNKHSQYAFNSKRFRTFCQKLVISCAYGKSWNKLLDCMVTYGNQRFSELNPKSAQITIEIGTTDKDEDDKKTSATEQLLKNLCDLLKEEKNFNLLLELKYYVRYTRELVCAVLCLASYPYRPGQQQLQQQS